MVVDQLAIANWQRSKDGAKGRGRPKPISPLAKKRGTRYGKTQMDPDAVKAFLRRLNPNQYGEGVGTDGGGSGPGLRLGSPVDEVVQPAGQGGAGEVV